MQVFVFCISVAAVVGWLEQKTSISWASMAHYRKPLIDHSVALQLPTKTKTNYFMCWLASTPQWINFPRSDTTGSCPFFFFVCVCKSSTGSDTGIMTYQVQSLAKKKQFYFFSSILATQDRL